MLLPRSAAAEKRQLRPLAGELRYRSPGHLEMLVRQPKPESFFYQNGVLTIDGGGASGREISVDSQILLSTLFTALVGTLSGDESKLRGAFDLIVHWPERRVVGRRAR